MKLSKCNLSSESVKLISTSQHFQTLKILNLRDNLYIKDTGIEIFSHTTFLNNLQYLNFSSCQLTDVGLILLLKNWNGVQNVEDLRVTENSFTDEIFTEEFSELLQKLENLEKFEVCTELFEEL